MKQARTKPLNAAYHQLSQLLYQAMLSLYTIPAGQYNKTVWQKTDRVLSLYEHHIAKEEAVLFGILHEYEPCVSATLRNDYKIIMGQVASLRKAMAQAAKPAGEEQEQQKQYLLYRFSEFVNICRAQMQEHQSIINPVLWRYYSNEELEQITAAFTIPASVYTCPEALVA